MYPDPEPAPEDHLLIEKFRRWVETHPEPDTAALAFLGRDFTPRQIRMEVEQGSELGRDLVSFLQYAGREYGVEPAEFLDRAIAASLAPRG